MSVFKHSSEKYLFAPGDIIGDFTVISAIGAGAYGEVYYVSDPLGAKFALKVIKEQLSDVSTQEISGISLLRTQVRAEEALPQIYHVGKVNDLFYYTMDAADNSVNDSEKYIPDTLQYRLDNGKKFSAQEIFDIAGSLLKSLHALHQRDLVHRDIKPSNIIFLDGKSMLTDFGLISKDPKTFIGSPGFLAPFPAGGITLQNQKEADLYSLGKVIYCMFSGEPAERFPLLPEEFSVEDFSVIRPLYQKACAVAHHKRFKSCEEFMMSIEKAQKQNADKSLKRRPLMLISVLLVLLAAIIAVVFALSKQKPDRDNTKVEEKITNTANDSATEAFVKVLKRNSGYQILVCFVNTSQEDADPLYRPNQFKAMSLVKMGMTSYLQASKSQKIQIDNIRYLKQPFKEGELLIYIYFISESDCRLVSQ